jgi:hypothetical protein
MYLTRNQKRIQDSLKVKEPREEDNYKEEDKYCLICWEPEDIVTNPVTKMKSIGLFTSLCTCDCIFHPNCFLEWASKTMTCPICRGPLTINMEIYYTLTLGKHYKTKLFCIQVSKYIVKVGYLICKYLFLIWVLLKMIMIADIIISNYIRR